MQPFETKIADGKRLYDIVHFKDPFNFSISEKVFRLLNGHGITGWKSYEIAIRDMDVKLLGFQVTGKCGPLIRPPEAGFIRGYKFEIETWDGSDFFYPEGTLSVFCTERARNVLVSNKITNLMLERIDSVTWYST